MNPDTEEKPVSPQKGEKLPIRAPWRYRADGTYYKGSSNLNYNTDYYHERIAGRRLTCEFCGADIAYTYKSKHQKRKYCQLIQKAKQEQKDEQELAEITMLREETN